MGLQTAHLRPRANRKSPPVGVQFYIHPERFLWHFVTVSDNLTSR
jgi:hypothetical protein